MNVIKVINNNLLIARDENDHKVILTGKGIGFHLKIGANVNKELISQKFVLVQEGAFERFYQLLNEIPGEIFSVVEEIIYYARTTLTRSFSDNVYLTLSDHLNFAISRAKQGILLENALHWETKNFYPDEYNIGAKALEIVQSRLSINLSVHEISFIAMHFVNAELNGEMSQTYEITRIIQNIQNIVKYHFNISFDENSLNYYRFITHLKFFAQRLLACHQSKTDDDILFEVVKKEFPNYYACAEMIKKYVMKQYEVNVSNQELTYLTIHLKRVLGN
ncbi:PRD domain-containing protein [Paenibacillus illinoisensis]|uniref:BglG family transcription antiterminator LicT n=1 Tax=Paenibacillus illinoisensis TaxID=59845 RepID=UPI003CFB3FEC